MILPRNILQLDFRQVARANFPFRTGNTVCCRRRPPPQFYTYPPIHTQIVSTYMLYTTRLHLCTYAEQQNHLIGGGGEEGGSCEGVSYAHMALKDEGVLPEILVVILRRLYPLRCAFDVNIVIPLKTVTQITHNNEKLITFIK